MTLDAVAAAAGVSKGGLLHHFPTKDALIHGMLDLLIAMYVDRQNLLLTREAPGVPGRWLRAYIDMTFVDEEEDPGYGIFDKPSPCWCCLIRACGQCCRQIEIPGRRRGTRRPAIGRSQHDPPGLRRLLARANVRHVRFGQRLTLASARHSACANPEMTNDNRFPCPQTPRTNRQFKTPSAGNLASGRSGSARRSH